MFSPDCGLATHITERPLFSFTQVVERFVSILVPLSSQLANKKRVFFLGNNITCAWLYFVSMCNLHFKRIKINVFMLARLSLSAQHHTFWCSQQSSSSAPFFQFLDALFLHDIFVYLHSSLCLNAQFQYPTFDSSSL